MTMYFAIKTLSRITCLLPAPLQNILGYFLGRLGWLAAKRWRRQMAIDNVMKSGLATTEEEAKNIVKASVYRFGPMLVEVLCFPQLTKAAIDQQVTITGGEYLTEALSHGKGAVLATAHSGNWELLGAALAYQGFPLVAVVKKQTNMGADRFINEYRTQAGMHVTYKTSVLEMVRLLAEGKIIGLLMDQDPGPRGILVDFLGRPTFTPQGPATLARMKDSPIVPAFITRRADGKHTIVLHPPVWVTKTSDRQADIITTTQKLSHIIETHIRKYPDEWFWLHNRWKARG